MKREYVGMLQSPMDSIRAGAERGVKQVDGGQADVLSELLRPLLILLSD